MTSKQNISSTESKYHRLLRTTALISVWAGAGGSFGLMLYAGRNNDYLVLMILFTVWVLAPFIALIFANLAYKRWSVLARTALYRVMLVIALGSLAIYIEDALGPQGARGAFVFVAVPLGSLLLIAIVFAIAALMSRRRSRRGDGG